MKESITDESTKTVSTILEEVEAEICDKYCKYPEYIVDEDELMAICEKCPLLRL